MNKDDKNKIELLKKKVAEKTLNSPQKAALIIKQWIEKKSAKKQNKKAS